MSLSGEELSKISTLIPRTGLIALKVKPRFETAEVEAFEQENNKDLTREGELKYKMLKNWYEKEGSTKDVLVQALKDSGMGELAGRVQKGILTKDTEAGATSSSGPSSSSTASSSSGQIGCNQQPEDQQISEATLKEIGKAIGTGLDELATQLGVSHADLRKYRATNYMTGEVTSQGTINMLIDWWGGASKLARPRDKLKHALQEAKLVRIQEEYLP